jgi:hypothetical protein
MIIAMKARIFIRAGRATRWHNGKRDKVAASHRRDDRPLQIGDEVLRTLHFAVDVEIPDALFKDPAMPVVEVQVEPDGTFRQDPVLVQVPIDAPDAEPVEAG